MKLSIAALSITLATTSAAAINSNSDAGRNLLSKARRLDGGGNDDNDYQEDTTWMQNFSLKFQGCRTALTYNSNADEDADVKVAVTKLAHFRLCASDSCTSWNGGGCNSGYGDYVVALEDFAEAFVQGQRRKVEYECQTYMFNNCDCNENDDKDDGFNREYCEYDCYSKNSKMASKCIDRNPYEEEGQEQRRFEPERYVGCQELELDNNGDDGNAAQVDYDEYGNAITYYVGSTCSEKGGEVYLAVYTDDTCTVEADTSVYKKLTGTNLPYSAKSKNSLITPDCVSCVEQEDPNRQAEAEANGEYYEEEIKISDACSEMYEAAGKCEVNLQASSKYSEASTEACSYIAGIKISRSNGILDTRLAKGSKIANAFIAIFGIVFVGIAGFVYFMHKKIAEAKRVPLLD